MNAGTNVTALPTQPPERKRILVADDAPIVRHGLRSLIEHESDLDCCADVDNPRSLHAAITTHRPDLLVLDLALAGGDGLEQIKALLAEFPALPIIAFSFLDEATYGSRALRAGARGFLRKQQRVPEILEGLRCVLGGGIYASRGLLALVFEHFVASRYSDPSEAAQLLSDRELCVLGLIGAGVSTRQIAERLHLSVKTIETYREHLKRKLGLPDGASLGAYARSWAQRAALPGGPQTVVPCPFSEVSAAPVAPALPQPPFFPEQ